MRGERAGLRLHLPEYPVRGALAPRSCPRVDPGGADEADRLRCSVRPVPAVSPPHAPHRGNRLSRALVRGPMSAREHPRIVGFWTRLQRYRPSSRTAGSAAQLVSLGQGATLRGMGALRSIASVAGLITALSASVHLAPSPRAVPLPNAAPTTAPATVVSTPQESLPAPVHDEATCAFCQAAVFAPHAGQPVGSLTLDDGNGRLVQLAHDDSPAFSASASPARSRAPPILRSV